MVNSKGAPERPAKASKGLDASKQASRQGGLIRPYQDHLGGLERPFKRHFKGL